MMNPSRKSYRTLEDPSPEQSLLESERSQRRLVNDETQLYLQTITLKLPTSTPSSPQPVNKKRNSSLFLKSKASMQETTAVIPVISK
jgi:hypothetical protein